VKHGGRNLPAASPTPHDSHSSPALSTGRGSGFRDAPFPVHVGIV
jgi:hypothetical protein